MHRRTAPTESRRMVSRVANSVYLGATRRVDPASTHLQPVRASARGKSLEPIACPMLSYVDDLVLLDADGGTLLETTDGPHPVDYPASLLVQFLDRHPAFIPAPVKNPHEFPVSWFGFDIRNTLHTLALMAMRARVSGACLPWQLWWTRYPETPLFLDPFEMLMPSAFRVVNGFNVAHLCKYLDLPVVGVDSEPSARDMASLARSLVLISGVFDERCPIVADTEA